MVTSKKGSKAKSKKLSDKDLLAAAKEKGYDIDWELGAVMTAASQAGLDPVVGNWHPVQYVRFGDGEAMIVKDPIRALLEKLAGGEVTVVEDDTETEEEAPPEETPEPEPETVPAEEPLPFES